MIIVIQNGSIVNFDNVTYIDILIKMIRYSYF